MITHHIIKHKVVVKRHKLQKVNKERFVGKHGTNDHRLFILRRAVNDCPFDLHETVLYKRNRYFVSNIYGDDDFDWLEWDGLAPKFIEICDASGVFFYVNSGQLKKVDSRYGR